ncbi:MAG: hypothetical protein AAF597_20925, partial [Bacteroidota bacterium]
MKALSSPQLPDFSWTVERYHRAIKLGVLTEDDKVELLFGRLIARNPASSKHAAFLSKLNIFFFRKYHGNLSLRSRNP